MPPKDLQHNSFLAQFDASSAIDESYPGLVLTVKASLLPPTLRYFFNVQSACTVLSAQHELCLHVSMACVI